MSVQRAVEEISTHAAMETGMPAGYKLTEVGVIPEHWEVRPAEQLCLKIQDGTHFSPKLGGYDYLYVTSKNIGFGILDLSSADTIDAVEHRKIYSRCDVKQGDLLLTKDGVNTGNAAINYLSEEFSLLSSVAFLRFDQRFHDPAFYLQYILSSLGQARLKTLMSGNAITRLTLQKIRNFRFPFPPLPEQRAIAAALSEVDALIASQEQQIAKQRALKTATMQQLLSGQLRLPGFAGEWVVKRLGDIAPLQRGFDLPNSMLRPGQYPVVYSNGIVNYHADFMARGPGVVTGRSGTLGKIHYVEQDYWPHNTSLWVTDFKHNNPKFIFYLYQHIDFERFASGSGVPTLNRNDAHDFHIEVPTSVEEQRAIATVLSDMDAHIAALEAQRDKTKLIKQGMMQQLLTGRVRL